MDKKLKSKFVKLKKILFSMEKVLVAFSAGVDSSLLLKVATLVLPRRVLAVTACSGTYPAEELKQARRLAKELGVKFKIIHTNELGNPRFKINPINRCYYCKKELFQKLKQIAANHNIKYILDGSNLDDNLDIRPGSKAKREFNVRSPLAEAGFRKKEIRQLSRRLGLKTWDKPSLACLASRIPYGTMIRRKDLSRIETAEAYLRRLGFRQVRLRHYNGLARIEVEKDKIKHLINPQVKDKVIDRLKNLGYNYVTVDLEGYRMGSMNQVRPKLTPVRRRQTK